MGFRTVVSRGTLSALLLLSAPAFAGQPRLVIESPRGGEYYVEGQTQQVRVSTRIRKVIVELSRDGGATYKSLGVIDNTVPDVSARGLLSWAVTAPPSKLCVIRARDEAGLFIQQSQHFCIGGVDVSGGAQPPNSVTSVTLADQAVVTAKLADGSVTTPKLADAAVTTVKIADEAVSAEKINSGPASNQFLLAANGFGGASWVPPSSILLSPNFGNQPIVTTSSVTSGSVTTGDLTVTGNVVLPPNSISATALPSNVTLQGNTFNGISQLVKLDNAGKLPALDGSALTNLSSSSLNGQAASYYLNRSNHTGTQTAATISDFDTQVRTSRLDQMAAPTASVALNAQKITGLADPAAVQDAATKNYVDTVGTVLNTAISGKVSKTGDTMTGPLLATGDGVKITSQAGAGDAGTVSKLEVLKSDNSSAFKVTANGDVTATSFLGPLTGNVTGNLTGTASNASQLNSQSAPFYLDRANHTGTQTAATISDFDTQVRTSRLDQMAAPTASVALNAQKITGVADPAFAQEAATKNYVDGVGGAKVSKAGDTMSGTLTAVGDGVKIVAKAGASDADTVSKLEVLKNDNTTAFKVTAGGDTTVGGVMTLQKAGVPAAVALATSGNISTNASLGNVFTIALSGNVTLLPPSNPRAGQRCIWRFRQPAAGGPCTVTIDTGLNGFRFGTDIPSVTLSTAANKVDYMGAIWNDVDLKWDIIAFVQGY